MIHHKFESVNSPKPHQGFLGQGHTATSIIDGSDLTTTDPFLLLMDDHLDLPGGAPVGGAHPHAGFETVTLVIKGDEQNFITGSMEVMTAGSGIIHTEQITQKTQMRILQLWLALPPSKHWTTPAFQQILLEDVPKIKDSQREIRVYSGSSQGLQSPITHFTPFTLIDFNLSPSAAARHELSHTHKALIYVLEGEVTINNLKLKKGNVLTLSSSTDVEDSELLFQASASGARFILYSGIPTKSKVISHGPFMLTKKEDFQKLAQDYKYGRMPHLDDLPESVKIQHKSGMRDDN